MRDNRKKLYNAADRFDKFLDGVLKGLYPGAKMGIVLVIGVLAVGAAWAGKGLLACILFGCGIAIWVGR